MRRRPPCAAAAWTCSTLSPTFHPDPGLDRFARLALEHDPQARITVQASWVPFDGLIYAHVRPHMAGRDALSGAAFTNCMPRISRVWTMR